MKSNNYKVIMRSDFDKNLLPQKVESISFEDDFVVFHRKANPSTYIRKDFILAMIPEQFTKKVDK